jgi:hypothetical protein
MKQSIPVALVFLMMACNSVDSDGAKQQPDEPLKEQTWFDTDTLIVWNCDAATETRSRIFKPDDSISIPQPFINGINRTWPEAKLLLLAIKSDTISVTIDNEQWLNNKSGNSGAEQYLSFAAMNLLEIKGIQFVQFEIKRGMHAGPSLWKASDFKDWKTDSLSLQ